MKHNQNHNIDLEFKLSAVRCGGCGAIFDTSHNKNCIYCGCECHAEDNDCIITSIKKIKTSFLVFIFFHYKDLYLY